jgi:hypothetical protein
MHEYVVAYPSKQSIGDSWRSAAATGNFRESATIDVEVEKRGRSNQYLFEFRFVIELQVGGKAEPVSERIRQ